MNTGIAETIKLNKPYIEDDPTAQEYSYCCQFFAMLTSLTCTFCCFSCVYENHAKGRTNTLRRETRRLADEKMAKEIAALYATADKKVSERIATIQQRQQQQSSSTGTQDQGEKISAEQYQKFLEFQRFQQFQQQQQLASGLPASGVGSPITLQYNAQVQQVEGGEPGQLPASNAVNTTLASAPPVRAAARR